MAEKLGKNEPLPWPPRARAQGYPWDKWMDGGVWRLTRGKDYNTRTGHTFRSMVYITARRRGGKAHVAIVSDDEVIMQFYKE